MPEAEKMGLEVEPDKQDFILSDLLMTIQLTLVKLLKTLRVLVKIPTLQDSYK